MSPDPAPVPLTYGDIVTQRGVTVTRDGATLRIRVPPRPLFPLRSASFAIGLTVFALSSVVVVVQAWLVRPLNGLLMLSLECLTVAGSVLLYRHHMRSPASGTIFELTDQTLTISANQSPAGTPQRGDGRWTATRPAPAITEIRHNPYDHSLLLRAPGHELLTGLLHKEDPRVIDHVASTLRAELPLLRNQSHATN
jgi:hypothetical protein